jgi:hypothetical protein
MENTLVRKMLVNTLNTAIAVKEMDFAANDLHAANNKVVADLNSIFIEKINLETGEIEFYLNPEGI